MIIVQLKGGLGNQLFQYSAGLSLGRYHHVPVKVDVSELRQPDEKIGTLRGYELDNLIDPPLIASQQDIESLVNQNLLKKYRDKLRPSYKRVVYNEKQFEFDKNFFNSGSKIFLKGYRQSEKYFSSIEEEIRTLFQLNSSLLTDVKKYSEQLNTTNSISIHIRRGDYAKKEVQNFHGTLSEEYYQNAINKIFSLSPDVVFYVFSDDMDWVKDKLLLKKRAEFISGGVSKNHYEDFYLMSQCKHNIIANSSFSWWGAWLNPNLDKIVIAPKKWFNNAPYDTKDLIPDEWIKL